VHSHHGHSFHHTGYLDCLRKTARLHRRVRLRVLPSHLYPTLLLITPVAQFSLGNYQRHLLGLDPNSLPGSRHRPRVSETRQGWYRVLAHSDMRRASGGPVASTPNTLEHSHIYAPGIGKK